MSDIVNGTYWPIDRVQKSRGKNIASIAKEFAERGLPLLAMAAELGLNYSSLKRALRLRGYKHPIGINLVSCKLRAELGIGLDDYLATMISKKESRNAIAQDIGVDNKTLQSYADSHGYVFPEVKPIPKDFTNINAANRSRKYNHCPIVTLGSQNGIPFSSIKKRIALGWNLQEIVGIPPGDGHMRRKPLVEGDVMSYVGKYSKTFHLGELVKIVARTREAKLIVESLDKTRRSYVLRKSISIAAKPFVVQTALNRVGKG